MFVCEQVFLYSYQFYSLFLLYLFPILSCITTLFHRRYLCFFNIQIISYQIYHLLKIYQFHDKLAILILLDFRKILLFMLTMEFPIINNFKIIIDQLHCYYLKCNQFINNFKIIIDQLHCYYLKCNQFINNFKIIID